MRASTFTARAGAVLVALVAGFASFRHIVGVALHFGEDAAVAYALPFCIDALMLVSVAAMAEDKKAGRRPRLSARVAFGFGVLASLGANVASADPTTGARVVAAVPALALLLAIEVLSRTGKTRAAESEIGMALESTRGGGGTATKPDRADPHRPGPRRSTAEKVAKAARRTPDASPATIAGRLGVSEATVRRHLRALSVDTTASPMRSDPVTVPAVVSAQPASSNGHSPG